MRAIYARWTAVAIVLCCNADVALAQVPYQVPRRLPRMIAPTKSAPRQIKPTFQNPKPITFPNRSQAILQRPKSISELDGRGAAPTRSPAAPTKPVAVPIRENVAAFDPRGVKLHYRNSRWMLAGGGLVKEFGRRQLDAQQALNAIQTLGLNQRGIIGSPTPVLEYWLSNGRAPSGLTPGLRQVPFNARELSVVKIYHEWFIRDRSRSLFRFGEQEAAARQALAVIHKHGFDRVAIVGQAVPSMLIFLRNGDHGAAAPRKPVTDEIAAQKNKPLHELPDHREEKTVSLIPKREKSNLTASVLPTSIVPALRQPKPQDRRGSIAQAWSPTLQQRTGAAPAVMDQSQQRKVSRHVFDWRQARLSNENGRWTIRAGGTVLGDFGAQQGEARLAYAALMHYRFSELHQVGHELPDAKYFLVRGQAPRGLMAGLFSESIQPEQMRIRQRKDKYFLTQRGRDVVECGTSKEDAEALLQSLKRYQFDHKCRVASFGDSSFTFFVRAR